MILKDQFLTQLAPDIHRKLLKQVFGPNQSLDNLLQLAQSIMAGNMTRKKGRGRPRNRQKPLLWLSELFLNGLRKMPRGPGWKGWACHYSGKEGHLKRDCPQASRPPPAPCPVCKGPHWRRDCPQRRSSQGLDSQDNQDWRCSGGPHTSSCPNYTWGTSGISNCGGPIPRFPFGHWGNLIFAYRSSGPLSPQSTSIMGLSGQPKCYYFSCPLSGNWDSAVFTQVFDRASFPHPFWGGIYWERSMPLFSRIWSPSFLPH